MTEIAVYNPHNATLLLGTAAVILTMAAAWWHHRLNGKSNRIPSKWRRVGHLSELNIYPLKSGREMPCQEAECTELGLRDISSRLLDRTFMVYGETDGKYMTAARFPRLLLVTISPGPGEDQVTFNAPECQPLTVNIPSSSIQDTSTCTVWWSEEVKTLDCGEEAAVWFSRYLLSKDSGARLGHYAEDNENFRRDLSKTRLSAFQEHYKKLLDHDVGAYSYLSGFMLLAESSIADLASRLPERLHNLSPRRFRGNFIAQETEPYEEDTWDWVRIGEQAIFRTVKPCTRCTITTVDPDTAIRDPQMEPLKTLRSYRRVTQPGARDVEGPDPIMGVYLGLRVPGIISAGDAIYVGYN